MWKGFGIYVALLLCLASAQAAVIRPEERQLELETTTAQQEAEVGVTTEASEGAGKAAQSRDKDATVQIELASVDPAPGTVAGDLKVNLAQSPQVKSAKLLLLSTPAKRPAEVEQQLEEQDENETAAAGSAEQGVPTTTQNYVQEQEQEQKEEESTTTENSEYATATTATTIESSNNKTTKLFAINATISSQDSVEPNVAVAVATDNATIAIAEQPPAAGDNNVAIELPLVETEAEYVLLGDGSLAELATPTTHDELQLGSFTHIDSDFHLQPVVHSVEIVPTSLDDPLIVNYVHNLR